MRLPAGMLNLAHMTPTLSLRKSGAREFIADAAQWCPQLSHPSPLIPAFA
jgi:hypothetical protein